MVQGPVAPRELCRPKESQAPPSHTESEFAFQQDPQVPPSTLKFEKLCLRKPVTSSQVILIGMNAHIFTRSAPERLRQKLRIDQVALSCGKEGKGQNWHIRRQQDREGEGRGGWQVGLQMKVYTEHL